MHKYLQLGKMVFTLTLIAVLSAFILGEVEQLTKAPIQEAKNQRELAAISEVVDEFDNNPFAERMIILSADKKDKLTLYPARKDGTINSVAIKTYSNNGFGGKIEMMVGLFMDGSITGYKIIDHKETPGLGTKVSEPKFKDQFSGFSPKKNKLKVRQDGGDIDAVTAATISSRAVIDGITRAIDAYNNFTTAGN